MLDLGRRHGLRTWFGAVTAGVVVSAGLVQPGAAISLPTTTTGATAVDVDPGVVDAVASGIADVVVRTTSGATVSIQADAVQAGAALLAELHFIDAFAVRVDSTILDQIVQIPGVVGVTLNRDAEFQGASSNAADGGDDFFEELIGASSMHAQGHDGSGVGIAILDSGVASVPTLGDRVGDGADVSGDADGRDAVGHGTFLAGIAAGDGSGAPSNGDFDGVAPGATIVPVKVGGEQGISLVALLEGLQWIHHNRVAYGIDVVNLSFGTSSSQPFTIDPLNYAVQQLWADGIVVVVAAGNLGDQGSSTITKPGDDPFVITVGSTDSHGTMDRSDDTIPSFSSTGPTRADGIAKPDLVAPGRSLVGPIAPGSAVAGMTNLHIADGWVRASGTSFSTAVVSGAVALLLDAHPNWTPDQIKGALLDAAVPGPVGDPNVDGHGALNVAAASAVTAPTNYNAGIPFGTGSGTLAGTLGDDAAGMLAVSQAAPRSVSMTTKVTTCVLGLCTTAFVAVDVPVSAFDFFKLDRYVSDFGAADWASTQWHGNQLLGNQWYGNQWYGNQWYGNQWYGNQWYGNHWYGNQWYGNQWYGNQWYGNQWYGNQWYGNQWYGNQWYGNQWYGVDWY